MTGSVWAPGSITTVNSANTVAPENQVGTQGQTLITLLNFTYPPNTNSILLWINGVLQASGIDYTEASASTLLLASGLTLGDRITVLGLTAIIGSSPALTFVRPSGSLFLNGFSATPPAIGPGLLADYGFVANQGRIAAYDWAAATYKNLTIDANTLKLNTLSLAATTIGGAAAIGGAASIAGILTLSGLTIDTGAASDLAIKTNNGVQQLAVKHFAAATRWVTINGSTGTPVINTSAGDLTLIGASGWCDFAMNSAPNPPQQASSGLSIGWNRSSGGGEVNLFSHAGGGTVGGFEFTNWTGAVATKLASLDANGAFKTFTAAGVNTFAQSAAGLTILNLNNTHATDSYGMSISFSNANPNDTTHYFLTCTSSGSAEKATIRANGGLANFSANNVNISDERMKKDWTLVESYYDRHLAIDYGYFLYKDQKDTDRNFGKLAQQVHSVMPEMVDTGGFGVAKLGELPYMAIYEQDYTNMLGAVLKETQQRLNALTTSFHTYVAAHP